MFDGKRGWWEVGGGCDGGSEGEEDMGLKREERRTEGDGETEIE